MHFETSVRNGIRNPWRRALLAVVPAFLALADAPTALAQAATTADFAGGIAADKDYVAAVERLRAEDYEAAAALLENLAAREPTNASVFNYLGYTYSKIGRNAEALAHYQRALFLDPRRRSTRAELGELYLKRGQIGKAEEQLAEIDRLCFFRCREFRHLKARIDNYKKLEANLPDNGQAPMN